MPGRGHLISLCGAVAAALALCAPAAAQEPTAPDAVIGGHLYPKPYGLAYVYGRLRVPAGAPPSQVAGQTVLLYQSAFPFTAWAPVATLTSDFKGYFSFHETIGQNMAFRAIWQGAAPVQSNDKLIKLPLRLRLRAGRVHRRQVTFSGNSFPAHPGAVLRLQELDARGRFRTVASAVLAADSRFRRSLRLRRPGVFRVLFPGDGQFGAGASPPLRIKRVRR